MLLLCEVWRSTATVADVSRVGRSARCSRKEQLGEQVVYAPDAASQPMVLMSAGWVVLSAQSKTNLPCEQGRAFFGGA